MVRLPSYTPWRGKRLAQEFVRKFRDDYPFLLPFLSSEEEFLRVSAVELLEYLCCHFETVPAELLALRQPLPDLIKEEVELNHFTRGQGIETVGDLLCNEYLPEDD
ncbi:hypothetical protein [Prosthecobacter sp.]|uniref:hypothetical protein n=1 Tax=Prosthecobacter sp. TaxID=1965333 RepID=UPI0037841262